MVTKILAICFGAIGAVALLATLFFVIGNVTFISQAATAEGTVTRLQQGGNKYRAVIDFTTSDGRDIEFISPVNSNPPEFEVEQKVRVYYKLDDPTGSARPDSFISLWFWPILSGIFTVVFGVLGLGFFSVYFLNQRKIKWLRRNGQRVIGHITKITLNTHVRNGGKSPRVVWVQWRDPQNGQALTFRSDNVWLEPLPFAPGMEIPVLIDPKNIGRYYVDTAWPMNKG
jgi:hypothetical protein